MLNAKGLDHINMNVSNLDSSVNFYKKLFGMQIFEQGKSPMSGKPYVIIGNSGKLMLALYESPIPSNGSYINHIGIHIDNFSEALSVLHHLNIPINLYSASEIVEYPNSQSIYISDPDGNEIELSSKFAGSL